MTRIAAVRCAVPPYRHTQREITDHVAEMCLADPGERALLERFHGNAGVATRHTVLPLAEYAKLDGFGAANDIYISSALELGAEAISGALDAAGLTPADVDLLMVTSVTGIAAPSLDARLVPLLGLRQDVKRMPLFGLGCVAGAAGVGRLHDYLLAWPDHVAVLLAVELCSLTVQKGDSSIPNLVASGLFGDGAAAVVAVGDEVAVRKPGPAVIASRSRLYPDTEQVMGWEISSSGFRIVLSAGVADVVREYLAGDVRGFLAEHGLEPGDVSSWVCHPGGPKVIDAVRGALGLPVEALELTRNSLTTLGNLSSVSVLHVLQETIATRRPDAGSAGMMLALGPGFCSELVLLRW